MDPGRAFRHEALQKEGRRDRAAETRAADVREVGHLAVEKTLVRLVQRQPPEGIALLLGSCQRGCRQSVAVAEERGQFGAERHPRGAGQGCHVQQQVGAIPDGFGQRIAENQAPLRIGVADLDRQALASSQDVERSKGVPRHGVLNRGHQHAEAQRQTGVHDEIGEAEHMGGTAHILLHQLHVGRTLEVEPAGVEADALADQCDLRSALTAGPGEVDQPRFASLSGSTPDRMHRRIVALQ